MESKLEDLSSRVRRLEVKEEQAQARQGRIPSQPEPAKVVTILQRGNPSEVTSNNHAFVGVVHVLQDHVTVEKESNEPRDKVESVMKPQDEEGTTEVPTGEEPSDDALKVAMMKMKNIVAEPTMDRGDDKQKGKAKMMEKGKGADEEEKGKNIPSPIWYSDAKRDKYFSNMLLKLSYFQQQLLMNIFLT